MAVTVIVAVGVVTWLAVADDGTATTSSVDPSATTVPGAIGPVTTPGAPTRGDVAPDFALPPVEGSGAVRLSDYAGTPVVLNFWQSFCTPCRDEFPMLRDADERAEGRYAVVGVDVNDIRSDARSFMRDEHAEWPSGFDVDKSVAQLYGVAGFPQTLFIDADGTIVSRVAGPLTERSLAANLRKLTG